MTSFTWQGVFPAMLTPFMADDQIDFELFRRNLEAQLSAGVDGIILGGSLGEASTLENSEKLDLLKASRLIVNDRIPVIMNIAEQSTKSAIARAREAEEAGANGLMLLPPMRYKADERETVAFFSSIARQTNLPIMIYNNPYDYKIEVTLDMFEELAKLSNIQAVKESTRDITNITRMRNRFGSRYSLLCGVDTLALEELASGADGWVAGLVDAFPDETVAIFRLVKSGKIEQALTIYRWFMPLLELDIQPKLVQYIKLAASQTGIGSEHVRAPRLVLEGAERISVLDLINTCLASRPALPAYKKEQAFSSAAL
jgi:4-hydroxy-tetrahydrodipicolinate synthase